MELSYVCRASAAFGLEGLVAEELRGLGMKDVHAENGYVLFSACAEEIFLCNLSLRFCDRIYIRLAEKECTSFEDLFRLVSSIPWEKYASGREAFNVSAKCARSRLMSPRDCQSITKKAILERLKSRRGLKVFPEDGCAFPVLVSVHSDCASILLNTSGESLSRRGYRTWNGEAPLRETLAAALVHLSPWKPGMPLYDPCCGTGTIIIEAALIAARRLPGIARPFSMEQFSCFSHHDFDTFRKRYAEKAEPDRVDSVGGSDIDPEAVNLAKRHIQQAGISGRIRVSVLALQSFQSDQPSGVFICNPPYGERLSDRNSSRGLYRDLRSLKNRHPGWALCVITSDPGFEKAFGMRADKKRRLYNGRLECTYYIYFGTRIPESD